MTTAWTPRQRAMLAEMGITVWAEEGGAAVAESAVPASPLAADTAVRAALAAEAASSGAVLPTPALAHVDAPGPAAVDGADWDALRDTAAVCTACDLHRGRTHSVFGSGRRGAHWLIVGEPPDDVDDAAGAPFSGPPGQLLDNMLRAIGVVRAGADAGEPVDAAAASLTTVVKCRPPDGRPVTAADVVACRSYLSRQIDLLQPRIVLAMGRWAARSLLGSDEPLGRLRGTVHTCAGRPVIVTYDPAYLLRNPRDKARAWADLCLAADTVAA